MRPDLTDVPASRFLLVGCGFAFVLVGMTALVVLWKADGWLADALAAWQPRVEARLPADLPEEERTRLAWAFDDAVAAVRGGWADEAALARLQERLAPLRAPDEAGPGAAARPGPLTDAEVESLIADLEAVAGRR